MVIDYLLLVVYEHINQIVIVFTVVQYCQSEKKYVRVKCDE